jgi:MFS family permease
LIHSQATVSGASRTRAWIQTIIGGVLATSSTWSVIQAGTLAAFIAKELGENGVTTLLAASTLGNAIGALIAGPIGEYANRRGMVFRRFIASGLLLAAVPYVGSSPWVFAAALFMNGAVNPIEPLVRAWLAAHVDPRSIGDGMRQSLVSLLFVGGLTGLAFPVVAIANHRGWREAFFYAGIAQFVMAALAFALPPDPRRGRVRVRASVRGLWDGIRVPQIRWAVILLFLSGAAQGVFDRAKGIALNQQGLADRSAWLNLGFVVSGVLVMFWGHRLDRRPEWQRASLWLVSSVRIVAWVLVGLTTLVHDQEWWFRSYLGASLVVYAASPCAFVSIVHRIGRSNVAICLCVVGFIGGLSLGNRLAPFGAVPVALAFSAVGLLLLRRAARWVTTELRASETRASTRPLAPMEAYIGHLLHGAAEALSGPAVLARGVPDAYSAATGLPRGVLAQRVADECGWPVDRLTGFDAEQLTLALVSCTRAHGVHAELERDEDTLVAILPLHTGTLRLAIGPGGAIAAERHGRKPPMRGLEAFLAHTFQSWPEGARLSVAAWRDRRAPYVVARCLAADAPEAVDPIAEAPFLGRLLDGVGLRELVDAALQEGLGDAEVLLRCTPGQLRTLLALGAPPSSTVAPWLPVTLPARSKSEEEQIVFVLPDGRVPNAAFQERVAAKAT